MRGIRLLAAGIFLLGTSNFNQVWAQSQVQPVVVNGGGGVGSPITTCLVGSGSSVACPMPVTVSGGSGSQVIAAPLAVTPTNDSLSLTTGGTAQTAIAANTTRKGCTVQNPATATDQGIATAENAYVNFTGTAAAASTSFELVPGQTISCAPFGTGVITAAVSVVAATTGHKLIINEFN